MIQRFYHVVSIVVPKMQVQKNQRRMKKKRVLKLDSDELNNNVVLHRQSSSRCCSEDESNATYELNEVASSSNLKGSGKTQASRGSATYPQSLYARVTTFLLLLIRYFSKIDLMDDHFNR